MGKRGVLGISFDHMHMGDLLRQVAEHPEAEIAGVFDPARSRMASAIAGFGIPEERVFTDLDDCLARTRAELAADHPELPGGIVLLDGGTNELAAHMSLEQTLERLAPPRLAGTPRAEFVERLRTRWAAGPLSLAIQDAIMGNFAVDAEDRIAPYLTYENHLKIVRAMWEQRPTQLYARVACPTLIVPAEMPPADERAAEWLQLKRRSVAAAAAAIPHARVVWAHDSIHDVQLQRPEWLAATIAAFARSL